MRSSGGRALLTAVLVVLAAGLLSMARFSSGNSYPDASSLNTGPAGTDLLFESLERSGKVETKRNFLPLDQVETRRSTVLLLNVAAAGYEWVDKSWFNRMEELARRSNRVVLGLRPGPYAPLNESKPSSKPKTDKRWDLSFRRYEKKITPEPGPSWHRIADGVWERPFENGSAVLFADAGRLNNRSLASNKESRALVPLLIGTSSVVIFDESHLGIAETGSIAALARRYRLTGLLTGLLILAALFIWRSAVQFPPIAAADNDDARPIAAADGRQLLSLLLKRHIAAADLLAVCLREWNRVRPKQHVDEKNYVGADPVSAFAAIREKLGRRGN